MDVWDGVLFVVAAAVAVRALVHLARRRHDLLVKEVQEQANAHRERMEEERKRKLREQQQEVA